MPLIGLTGGYATGKSTVSHMFVELGATLIDCDALAREVVEPGSEGLARVVEEFGDGILNSDGTLNRRALGDIVFPGTKKRRALESILHPLIIDLAMKRAEEVISRDPMAVVVVEAALLFESGLAGKMDFNVVVTSRRKLQLERGLARYLLTEKEVMARVNAQGALKNKTKLADHAIDNSGSLADTRLQVEKVWNKITGIM